MRGVGGHGPGAKVSQSGPRGSQVVGSPSGTGSGDLPARCPPGQKSVRSRGRNRAFHPHGAPSRRPSAASHRHRADTPAAAAAAHRELERGRPGSAAPSATLRTEHAQTPRLQGPIRPATPAINRSRQPRPSPRLSPAPPPGAGPAPTLTEPTPPPPASSQVLDLRGRIPAGVPRGARSRESRRSSVSLSKAGAGRWGKLVRDGASVTRIGYFLGLGRRTHQGLDCGFGGVTCEETVSAVSQQNPTRIRGSLPLSPSREHLSACSAVPSAGGACVPWPVAS